MMNRNERREIEKEMKRESRRRERENKRLLQKLPRFSPNSLQAFLSWIEQNRSRLEADGLQLPSPEQIQANPMHYMSHWLEDLGLSMRKVSDKNGGEYVLDPESLRRAKSSIGH